MARSSSNCSTAAGPLIELTSMRTKNKSGSKLDSLERELCGGQPTKPQPPPARSRHKLPWLVARDAQLKEKQETSEEIKLAGSYPSPDLPSTKENPECQSPANENSTKPFYPSFEEPGEFQQIRSSHEERHPLLEPDESDWAANAIKKLNAGTSHAPSPSSSPTRDETRNGIREHPTRRSLFRRIGTTSSTPLNDAAYSLIGSSEGPRTTINGKSAAPQEREPAKRYSPVTPPGKKDSDALKTALDSLEELMNEALRMAEHGLSPEERHSDSPSNPNRVACTAYRERHPQDATGPLRISSSSSSSALESEVVPSSIPGRWWSRPESRDGADSRPVSPFGRPGNTLDEKTHSSEDGGIIQENTSRQKASRSTRVAGSAFAQLPREKPADSKAIDWAYVPRPKRPKQTPASDSSDSSQSIVRRPIPVHGPTAPTSTQPTNREQVNYLDRKPTEDEPNDNLQRFYTAPELHSPHFVEGKGRGRRRKGAHQLLPPPPSPDEDVRQSRGHRRRPHSHFVENIESLTPYQEPLRVMEESRRSSSIGSEPEDGKLTLGETDPEKLSLRTPRRRHHSLIGDQPFSLSRHHRRQLVARDWYTTRKRLTALVACMNTALLGLIIGIYAGEVPSIQYYVADTKHEVILGNVVLYLGMAITTILFWPMPLLHGRRRYLLTALSLAVPLQFPQALSVQSYRSPLTATFRAGLLVPRAVLGLALGFANINCISVLLDLFGASLQSKFPHQEIVTSFDLRRHGGGLGLWLGFWTWCSIGSLAVGFFIGAGIIQTLSPAWGFYLVVILAAFFLFLNVICPETRRARFRRTVGEFVTEEEQIRRRVARGEVKIHISQIGPKWWFEELTAGLILMKRMLSQTGFLVIAVFTAWIYAQIVLVIVLLGALLSRIYVMKSSFVGMGVAAIAIGGFLAVPLSKANILSRDRKQGQRTDSMTFEHNVTWSSHFVRRLVFTTVLPVAGTAYTAVSVAPNMHWMAPIIFAGLIGFLSNLAIAECYGLIMETYDTSDIQPGVNSKHRLQSLAPNVRQRRTNYSSYPRVSAGIFATQGLSFLFAAGATGIGGKVTRDLGAPLTTGIWAAILLGLTILLALVLWRFKSMRVIPEQAFGTRRGTRATSTAWKTDAEDDWKPVVIGNPSGKMRRMNLLELGRQSRWTEIRRLNKLQKD